MKHDTIQKRGINTRKNLTNFMKSTSSDNDFDESQQSLIIENDDSSMKTSSRRHSSSSSITDLRGDYLNILLLLFLYILQGIPLGLAGSIPLILSNRSVSYGQQAIFSFVSWPFSVKLIWAPIVDAIYSERFGRRKTWLVPTQYLIGLFMLMLSYSIDNLLNNDGVGPNIYLLTFVFLILNFLAATQDIAVDGWALTMLSRRNVGYASTCNTVGQTAGYFLGNVVFLALESPDFCNKYLRTVPQTHGLITLAGFFFFWGYVFIFMTTLVMLFKTEVKSHKQSTKSDSQTNHDLSVWSTYSMLYRIFRLPSVRLFTLVLLTCKIGFSVTDASTGLKLIEAGVHKENLALLAIPLVPLQIILPWFISKYTAGPRPLNIYIKAYPYRLGFSIVFAILLWWTKSVKLPDGTFPNYYYIIILVAYGLHQISLYCMYVAVMAFHARVSDPSIGGTYMTLLNTVTNLGGVWPSTCALWLIDKFTFKSCSVNEITCNDAKSSEICKSNGGQCVTDIDGYYIEVFICVIIGILWYFWGKDKIRKLQQKPLTSWKCV